MKQLFEIIIIYFFPPEVHGEEGTRPLNLGRPKNDLVAGPLVILGFTNTRVLAGMSLSYTVQC